MATTPINADVLTIGIIGLLGIVVTLEGLGISLPLSEHEAIALVAFLAVAYVVGILVNALSYWMLAPFFVRACVAGLSTRSELRTRFYEHLRKRGSKLTGQQAKADVMEMRDYVGQHGAAAVTAGLSRQLHTLIIVRGASLSLMLWIPAVLVNGGNDLSRWLGLATVIGLAILLVAYVWWKEGTYVETILRKLEAVLAGQNA